MSVSASGTKVKIPLPAEIKKAGEILTAHGKQAFLVGGAPRDFLLGLPPQDYDLATDAEPSEIIPLFQRAGARVILTGARFGTITVATPTLSFEITTFRTEEKYTDFRHPDKVKFVKDILRDLSRRDFTINALAYHLKKEEIYDPFGGLQDLEKGLIRTVGDPGTRFQEDALRMLRAARFRAQLGFKLAAETNYGIVQNAFLLSKIAPERIQEEFLKILLAPGGVEVLRELADWGLLFLFIPELKETWGFPQHRPEHTLDVFDHLRETVRYVPPQKTLKLAALLHDIAKPRCFEDTNGEVHFYRHAPRSAEMAAEILLFRLRVDKKTAQQVSLLVSEHMFPLNMGLKGMRRLIFRIGEEQLANLLLLKQADLLATYAPLTLPAAFAAYFSFCRQLQGLKQEISCPGLRLAVNGHDVMQLLKIPPGPRVGKILSTLKLEVIDNPQKNNREYLSRRIKELEEKLN